MGGGRIIVEKCGLMGINRNKVGPPNHFHASQSNHARPPLPSRSLRRRSPQAISTLHSPTTLVRRFRLAPSGGDPPKLFPRFTVQPRSSGASVSLPPAEIRPSYFHFTVQPSSSGASVSLPPAEIPPSYSQAIPTLSTPSALMPSFLPFFLPSCLPSFLPPFLPAFLPSLLVRLFCLAPLAAKEAKREPKHRRCFWEKHLETLIRMWM